jgi:SNF2 family DNA or RNA helicase
VPEVIQVPLVDPPPGTADPLAALEGKCQPVSLASAAPVVRRLGKLTLEVSVEGWRFPAPLPLARASSEPRKQVSGSPGVGQQPSESCPLRKDRAGSAATRPLPPADVATLRERLLYTLQPPVEQLLSQRHWHLPAEPYPYQLEGIAFLLPRWSALLADEMGLGKTVQAILAMRLLFQGGLIRSALIVCPKPLVPNWCRELQIWAADLPWEVIAGDSESRRMAWRISNCPVKLVNYELLTRDAHLFEQETGLSGTEEGADSPRPQFDLVVLDEAQRIKNRDSRSAQVVCSIPRQRSWALTGTPVENHPEDLISIFAFLKPGYLPSGTPVKRLPGLTGEYILRRVKEDVLDDLPPKVVRDTYVELTPAQRDSYRLAESEGVVRLNRLGETVTVQHVFELILRLKQICNFDPATGESAKLEALQADLAEVADSGRKAIVFSQWIEPLEILARELAPLGPLVYHGKVPPRQREAILTAFRTDPGKRVLLMSYGTGSVGLNLQVANYVFLFDRWWNPAVEDQAINRVHRIGQRQPVIVTRFVAQNTIEGRICQILERKRQLFSELIEPQEASAGLGLTEEEIFGLFGLQPQRQRRTA